MIDEPFDDAGLIADLMELPEIAADIGVRDLPDQAEHRNIGGKGGQERRPGIEQTRSRHHGESLRLAGRQRRAERHIGGALLVPGVDGVQPVRILEQRFEQKIVLHAGQGIDGVEAVAYQRRDHRFGRRHGLGGSRRSGGLFAFLGHSCSWLAASVQIGGAMSRRHRGRAAGAAAHPA